MTQPERNLPRPDPLIDEIRAIRKTISSEYANDVDRLCAHLRRVQQRYASRLVDRTALSNVGGTPNELAASIPKGKD